MIAELLGAASASLVILFAATRRRDRERTRALVRRGGSSRRGPFEAIGVVTGRVPFLCIYAKDERARANLVLTAIVSVIVSVVSVKLAIPVATLMLLRTRFASRRRMVLRRRAILRELPIVADLLRLCISGGMNVSHAVTSVSRFLEGPIAAELRSVQNEVGNGARLAESLEAAAVRLCDDVQPLFGALVSSERYGAPLSTVLERLAFEARRAQEHRAEQAARQLSVKMLFPVAVTILPAFALLTVAPLLAGSFASLASSFQ